MRVSSFLFYYHHIVISGQRHIKNIMPILISMLTENAEQLFFGDADAFHVHAQHPSVGDHRVGDRLWGNFYL